MVAQLVEVETGFGAHHHRGYGAHDGAGDTDGHGLDDQGMFQQRRLDAQRGHLQGTRLDDVAVAVDEAQVARLVDAAEVAHAHPPVAEDGGGGGGVVLVAARGRVRAQPHLADGAGREGFALLVRDPQVTRVGRAAEGVRAVRVDQHADLGGHRLGAGVVVDQERAGEERGQTAGEGRRQRRRRGADQLDRAQVVARGCVGAQQFGGHRGHEEDGAGPVSFDQRAEVVRVEASGAHQGGMRGEGFDEHHLRGVGADRERVQHGPRVGVAAWAAPAGGRAVAEVGVGRAHVLRGARAAGGAHDLGEVPGSAGWRGHERFRARGRAMGAGKQGLGGVGSPGSRRGLFVGGVQDDADARAAQGLLGLTGRQAGGERDGDAARRQHRAERDGVAGPVGAVEQGHPVAVPQARGGQGPCQRGGVAVPGGEAEPATGVDDRFGFGISGGAVGQQARHRERSGGGVGWPL